MKDDKDTVHHAKATKSTVLDTGVLSSLVSLKPGQSVEVSRDAIRDVIWDARIAAGPKGKDKDSRAVKAARLAREEEPPTREEIGEAIAAAHVPQGIIVTLLDSGNYQFYRPIGEDTVAVEDIKDLPKGTRVAIRT